MTAKPTQLSPDDDPRSGHRSSTGTFRYDVGGDGTMTRDIVLHLELVPPATSNLTVLFALFIRVRRKWAVGFQT
jgi:hypothetical protein